MSGSMSMLPLQKIVPMQRCVRNHRQIKAMVKFIQDGGRFDVRSLEEYAQKTGVRAAPLIQIEVFEDGQHFSRDGHHRLRAINDAECEYLFWSEYVLVPRTYSQYMEINLAVGWVTPFDPRTEVRKEDLSDWKLKVSQLRATAGVDEAAVIEFIRAHRSEYSEPRGNINHIRDIHLPEG